MRIERNGVAVETFGEHGAVIVIHGRPGNLDVDDLRWLQAVALPAALDNLAKDPSGGSDSVLEQEPSEKQTTIEEMIETA